MFFHLFEQNLLSVTDASSNMSLKQSGGGGDCLQSAGVHGAFPSFSPQLGVL